MNTISKIAISSILTATALGAGAQSLTQNEKRHLRIEALQLLDRYEQTSNLSDYEESIEFRYLFPDEGINIFNDLLGVSTADSLNVDDYVEQGQEYLGHSTTTLKDVKVDRIWSTPEANMIELSFKKQIEFSTKCGAYIDAGAYFGGDYNMTAVIASNKETGDTRIVSLTGTTASNRKRLDPEFTYVEHTSPRDFEVKANGDLLTFSHGQALVPTDVKFEYADDDVDLKVKTVAKGKCTHYELQYRPKPFRVKVYGDISLMTPFSIKTPGDVTAKSSDTDFGVDFGYVIPSKSKFKVGVFLGLGYSMAKVDLALGSLSYNYDAPAAADMDGDTYRRYYTLSDFSQRLSLGRVAMPLYADFEYRAHKIVSVYADLGVRLLFNAAVKEDNLTGQSDSWGVYPQYDNLVMHDTWLNDFGERPLDATFAKAEGLSSFGADLLVGLGIRVKIYGPLMFDAGIRYQMGLTNISKAGNGALNLVDGATAEANAPVTYTVSGGTHVNSLSGYISSLKTQSLKLNVGLIMKF